MNLGTSSYSNNDRKEAKSRSRTHTFFDEETVWKFRDIYQQDNDIDGEIEVFEAHKVKEPQTTAKFIKVQLKSTDNPKVNIEKQEIVYEATAKFVRFCFLSDQPIILIIHDIPERKAYYVWMQQYIFETLEKNNPTWKDNTSGVTLRYSTSNLLSKENLPNLKSIAINGTQQILKMRETSSYKEHYAKVQKNIRKGGIYLAEIDKKIRPVYVAGSLNRHKVFIAPLTSKLTHKKDKINILLKNGQVPLLRNNSLILVRRLDIIYKEQLLDYFGDVPHSIYRDVCQNIKSFF